MADGLRGYVMLPDNKIPLDNTDLGQVLKDAYAECNRNTQVQRFAIEFPCGDCCKRLSNISVIITIDGRILIAGAQQSECMLMETICKGKLVEKQILSLILMERKRVCSIERYIPSC